MKYIIVYLRTSSKRVVYNEILIARLSMLSYEAFEEHFGGVDAYISQDEFDDEALKQLQKELSSELDFSYEWQLLEEKNWNEQWEAKYSFLEVGEELLVRSSSYQPQKKFPYEIIIDPKMAFGTGHHETTKLMLEQILQMNLAGKKVLDVGCGTGILSIVASLRGAQEIVAIDIDDNAYENTKESLEVNKVNNVKVLQGTVEIVAGYYDLILANINRNVLLQDLSKYKTLLKKGGEILISGFYEKDIALFDSQLDALTLTKCEELTDNEWSLLKIRKK